MGVVVLGDRPKLLLVEIFPVTRGPEVAAEVVGGPSVGTRRFVENRRIPHAHLPLDARDAVVAQTRHSRKAARPAP